jgi:hypothetical protein
MCVDEKILLIRRLVCTVKVNGSLVDFVDFCCVSCVVKKFEFRLGLPYVVKINRPLIDRVESILIVDKLTRNISRVTNQSAHH